MKWTQIVILLLILTTGLGLTTATLAAAQDQSHSLHRSDPFRAGTTLQSGVGPDTFDSNLTGDPTGDGATPSNRPSLAQANCQATMDDGVTLYGTVQAAVDAANPGDTVKISGYCAGVEVRGGLTQTVHIDNKPLTLRGGYTTTNWLISDPTANPTTLDAQRMGRVLVVTGTAGITIENLTVTSGTVSGNSLCPESCGGGILATGPLSLTGVTVVSNTAGRDGGGVAAMGTAKLTSARFERNAADFDGAGLAVFGAAAISGTTFANNTSALAGGGAKTEDTATITNSRFEENQSTANVGGGLRAGGYTTLVNTTFISNSASGNIDHGGGLYAFGASIVAVESQFENNRCGTEDCDGGGLYLSSSFNPVTFTLTNTTFISNSAGRNGGGAYVNGMVALSGGRFERNRAGGSTLVFSDGGGGLYARTLSLRDTQFIDNESQKDGGGVWAGSTASMLNGWFEGNSSGRHGGGLAGRAYASPLILTDTRFISNTAQENGGGLWVELNGVNLVGGRFERNRSNAPPNDGGIAELENGGGGVWASGAVTTTGTEFMGNTARSSGGGAHVEGDAFLNGGLFEDNQAFGDFFFTYGGGGVYIFGDLVFNSTVFSSNQATYYGGGGLVIGSTRGTGGLFQGNHSDRSAGGLYGNDAITLTSTQFIDNFTESTGGGVLAVSSAELTNSLFKHNRTITTTFGGGGGIRAGAGLWVTNTQFISNVVATNGGGVLANDGVTLTQSLFQGNQGGQSGGGLSGSFDPVAVRDSHFLSNTSGMGGGISSFGPITLTNSLLKGNHSNGEGGGLRTNGLMVLFDSQLIGNSAQGDGGGAWANSGAWLFNSWFERNISQQGSGGGLMANLGTLESEQTAFVSNTAALDGGGAFSFEATLVEGNFEQNLAQRDGGGLRVLRRLTLTSTEFIHNSTGSLGGGVAISYTSGRSSRLINGLFARNIAGAGGSGLYLNTSGVSNILHTTIASPTLSPGQAVLAENGTVTITNGIFSNYAVGIEAAGTATISEDNDLFHNIPSPTVGAVSSGGGSFAGDPAFGDPFADDYHLTLSSEAIDKGVDAGISLDFENDPRPEGTAPDIGYDESPFTLEVDLSIRKAVSTSTAQPGESIAFTIAFSQTSPNALAHNLTITDMLPVELSNLSVTSSGATITPTAGVTYSWTAQDLGPGEGGAITITGYLVSPLASGIIIPNTAAITTTDRDADPANNKDYVSVIVANATPQAVGDAAITNEDTSVSINVLANDSDLNGDNLFVARAGTPENGTAISDGNSVTYAPAPDFYGTDIFTYTLTDGELSGTGTVTVTVSNINDPPLLSNVAATTPIYVNETAELAGSIIDPDSSDSYTLTVDWGDSSVVTLPYPVGTSDFNASHTYSADGVYTATLTVADNHAGMDSDMVRITVNPQADLALSKTVSDDPALSGATLVYTLTAANFGPSEASGATLTDHLPRQVNFAGASDGCTESQGIVTCFLETLPEGTSQSVGISVTLPTTLTGIITNTASLKAVQNDPIVENDLISIPTLVQPTYTPVDDDFEDGADPGWCVDLIDNTPTGESFLGQLGNETQCLILKNLPDHTTVNLSFDLFILRSWDGNSIYQPSDPDEIIGPDHWRVAADSMPLLDTTFSNWDWSTQAYPLNYPDGDFPPRTGATDLNSLGYLFQGVEKDSIYHLSFIFAHTGRTLEIDFSAFGLQDIADESWGLDNVRVTLDAGGGYPNKLYMPVIFR